MPGICTIPGCSIPVYRNAKGRPGRYCTKSHKSWGEKGCILCRRAEKLEDSKFCFTCDIRTKRGAPMLVPVPWDHETYRNVLNQFKKSWKHPTPCPKVQAIYKIVASRQVLDEYNTHRNAVEVRGRFASRGLNPGNQLLRWHGTTRGCNVGDSGRTSFCRSARCSLCRIMRSSFDISYAKKNTGWGRFGRGIYTSSVSSKSNDYSTNLVHSPWKAVLLVYVVLGRGKKFRTNHPELTQAPAGFDSVIGEPSPTGSLNYDEFVVYANSAVCPAYLVTYDS